MFDKYENIYASALGVKVIKVNSSCMFDCILCFLQINTLLSSLDFCTPRFKVAVLVDVEVHCINRSMPLYSLK